MPTVARPKVPLTAILAIMASVLFWGLSFVSSKAILNTGFPPMTMVFARFLIASALLLPLRRRLEPQRSLRTLSRRQRLLLVLSGLTGVTVYFFFEARGIKLTSASNASLIVAVVPVLTVLTEVLLFRGRLAWYQAAGIALSILGVFFIVRRSPEHFPRALLGNLFMFGACLSWVAYNFISRDLQVPLAGLSLTSYQAAVGAITLLPLALSELASWQSGSLVVWLNILYLGVFCSALGYFCYIYALSHMGPIVVTSFINLIPVVGAFGGMLILGERLSPIQLAGGAVVIGGVFLVNLRRS